MNLVKPGSVINFGMWPFISDLRTGAFSGGSGEEALVMAASAQLCNHYGFITSVACGMTDSKTMDAQAGYEKAITTTALALSGANLIAAYPGIVGSLLGQSFEGMVIDNDMLGNVQRLLRGIEVTDETLSYERHRGHRFRRRALSEPAADPGADADGIPVPGSGGPPHPGRVGSHRQGRHLRTGPRAR